MNAADTVGQTGAPTPNLSNPSLDIDDDLNIAAALNDLAYWIAHARQFIGKVKFWAEHDATLGERLAAHGIHTGQAEWDDAENEALQYLQLEIACKLHSIRATVDVRPVCGASQ